MKSDSIISGSLSRHQNRHLNGGGGRQAAVAAVGDVGGGNWRCALYQAVAGTTAEANVVWPLVWREENAWRNK